SYVSLGADCWTIGRVSGRSAEGYPRGIKPSDAGREKASSDGTHRSHIGVMTDQRHFIAPPSLPWPVFFIAWPTFTRRLKGAKKSIHDIMDNPSRAVGDRNCLPRALECPPTANTAVARSRVSPGIMCISRCGTTHPISYLRTRPNCYIPGWCSLHRPVGLLLGSLC